MSCSNPLPLTPEEIALVSEIEFRATTISNTMSTLFRPHFHERRMSYRPSEEALQQATRPVPGNPGQQWVDRNQIVKVGFSEACATCGCTVHPLQQPLKPWDPVWVMGRDGRWRAVLVLSSTFELHRCPEEARPPIVEEPTEIFFQDCKGFYDDFAAAARNAAHWLPRFGVGDYLIDKIIDGHAGWERTSAFVAATYDRREVIFEGWAMPTEVRDAPRLPQRGFVREDQDASTVPTRPYAYLAYDSLHSMRSLFDHFAGFDAESPTTA